ncbi:TMEM165/GDT1 family protein [Nostocaceae cyanobacterium CENA357]|uniref:GDT1 family protein n=1 Tax=Atlanticothrix silvestris CENA357 TaxID=1725252 RepID=A0A8J7L301_9CYAN|nr:TMEM165/GDT1 family protein [Atlanticothrix silvestris]MBH8553361.1 TMEM165/GDT1 family protein [Atlanticothrix silvestris CENA357]
MKLDSAPMSLSGISETEYQPELKDSTESDLTTAIIEPLQPVVVDSQTKQESATAIFGTTFITIFLAEIGDKTQLSTLLMSAESHSPWVVFLGSAAALVTTSFLGVLLGSWIASRLSPKIVEKSAGVMLLLISIMLFWDVINS